MKPDQLLQNKTIQDTVEQKQENTEQSTSAATDLPMSAAADLPLSTPTEYSSESSQSNEATVSLNSQNYLHTPSMSC